MTPDHVASALLVDGRGRHLMQIRGDVPHMLHPGALGLFGGGIEAGEEADGAVRRELDEEIGFLPGDLGRWRTLWVPLRHCGDLLRSAHVEVFAGTIEAACVPGLEQRKGRGSR